MNKLQEIRIKRKLNRALAEKPNSTVEMYATIRAVLTWFVDAVMKDIGKQKLDTAGCDVVVRSLAYMNAVAENPEKHFSREATIADWDARAMEYAKSHNLPIVDGYGAHNLVWSPADVVHINTTNAIFNNKLSCEYRDFCKLVMDWEYNRTSANEQELVASMAQAREIVRIANNIFDNKKQNFFLRMAASFRAARAH
jgi:hypothetical protein